MHLSGYRFMWVVVMFDLPVDTRQARREYTRFRKVLLKDGFVKLQFSVYGRHCPSEENADVHTMRVELFVPPDGEVRVVRLTDKQFERMRVFIGKRRTHPEQPAPQLQLF